MIGDGQIVERTRRLMMMESPSFFGVRLLNEGNVDIMTIMDELRQVKSNGPGVL
jgi:hypothetical protein